MVSVSELRANLSPCLREAHLGAEIQVFDWVVPVANWCRLRRRGDEGSRDRLIAAGFLRLDTGGAAAILDEPPSKATSVSAANGTTMSSGVSPRSAALLAPATTLGWASRRSIGRWDAKWSSSSSRDERRSGCYIGLMSLSGATGCLPGRGCIPTHSSSEESVCAATGRGLHRVRTGRQARPMRHV